MKQLSQAANRHRVTARSLLCLLHDIGPMLSLLDPTCDLVSLHKFDAVILFLLCLHNLSSFFFTTTWTGFVVFKATPNQQHWVDLLAVVREAGMEGS